MRIWKKNGKRRTARMMRYFGIKASCCGGGEIGHCSCPNGCSCSCQSCSC